MIEQTINNLPHNDSTPEGVLECLAKITLTMDKQYIIDEFNSGNYAPMMMYYEAEKHLE